MATLYKGAGPATHFAINDARISGFVPVKPSATHSKNQIVDHIRHGPLNPGSPYISLSASFTVAYEYALVGRHPASTAHPGYVYHIDLPANLPQTTTLLDPIKEIGASVGLPHNSVPYQHDGWPDFLLGVIDPHGHRAALQKNVRQPGGATLTAANLTPELEALTRALRDAEVLVLGAIPQGAIVMRQQIP